MTVDWRTSGCTLLKDLAPAARKRDDMLGYCNLWVEDHTPLDALVGAIEQMSMPRQIAAKMRAKLYVLLMHQGVTGPWNRVDDAHSLVCIL